MTILYRLSITYLIVYLNIGLEAKSVIGPLKNNCSEYDKADGIVKFHKIEFYDFNDQYARFLSDLSNLDLEQSVHPTEVIESTGPSTRESYLNKTIMLDKPLGAVVISNALANVNVENTPDTDLENKHNSTELDRLLVKLDGNDGNSCLLDSIKTALLWWTFPNGTLRVSNLNITPIVNYLDLSYRIIMSDEALYAKIGDNNQIVAFSAAYNNLTTVPRRTLKLIGNSLKYLTLSGNQFIAYRPDMQKEGDGIAWSIFPRLPNLIELDISNCHIEYVTKDAFRNLKNLKRLYISHNNMLTMPFDTFYYTMSLQYLDLSFTNDYNYKVSLPSLEAITNLNYGVKIQQTTFKYLPNLVYLDLSHTKLTRNSAVAFTYLGENLKYLSLCYTSFPMIGNAIFKNTALIGLDLSGNTYAAKNILDDAFEGVSDSLNYLYFERSNLKDLDWLKYLNNLRLLGLAGNNINSVTLDKFSQLHSLQVLDLSSNHVGNWYKRVFLKNENLRVLNLRDNNINIITSEMLKDFSLLDYLSLGDNNFVCDCMLKELVDLSAANNIKAQCRHNFVHEFIDKNMDVPYNVINITLMLEHASHLKFKLNQLADVNIPPIIWMQHLKKQKDGVSNLKKFNNLRSRIKMRFVLDAYNSMKLDNSNQCEFTDSQKTFLFDKLNGSILKFQLLDYEEERYWCFNETETLSFVQLNCQKRSYVDDIVEQLSTLTAYVIACMGTLLAVSIIGAIIYLKRWHIHYYYSSLKSAALMSVAAKENANKFNALAEQDPNMIYDMFISYCQNDRDWVLEELVPNVEETGDISICLHERDFQIGVTILDNIVSCMERSRALMLIISSNFLLSHWCQFEMHLAQHRIFDVNKERLILVFLEDIPRSKRPKNLQYLMDVKTYIKWPGVNCTKEIRPEDRKLFWKRLRRSIINIRLNHTESRA